MEKRNFNLHECRKWTDADSTEFTDRIRAIKPTIDTSYKTVNGIRLPIKVYIPENTSNDNAKIAVVAIHGGAWYGIKEDSDKWDGEHMNYQAQYYYDLGCISAAISYRSIDFSETTTMFDLLKDCRDSIAFLQTQADFEKLILIGDSAGGHLALMLALASDLNVNIVIAANPPTDLTAASWEHTAKTTEEYRAISPVNNIHRTDTSFLLIHGEKDTVVSPAEVKVFSEVMSDAGNLCVYREIPNASHAFILNRYKSDDKLVLQYMGIIDDFIAENINRK